MTLIQTGTSRAPIAEGDPLPPEDAVPIERAPSIGQVYRDTRPRLLKFLSRQNTAEDADDLVQQSFVRLLSKHAEGRSPILRFDSYLFRVARNLKIDSARAALRGSFIEDMPVEEIELAAPEQFETPDQIAALEARDMLHRLEAVIQRMKPRTREIFLAHRIDGYSYGEIAALTGLSVKGVEKHMSRAIATIDRNMRAPVTRGQADSDAETVRAEAHDWIVRMHGPDAAISNGAFQAWLDEDPARAIVYRDLQAHWDRAKFLTHTDTGRARDLSKAAVWYRRPGSRWAAAAIAIFILAGGLALSRLPWREPSSPMIAYSTRVGEMRKVALADGSSVTLDAGSTMQVTMTQAAREVRLIDGSARFDIRADPSRIFTVTTVGGTVTTTGGLFDVTRTPALVRVTAIKATLNFKGEPLTPGLGSTASLAINPGQRLSVAGRRPPEIANAPQNAQDWTSGMLSFDGERLSDAVLEFNRHNARKIVLLDASLADLRITGAFHAGDPDGFARTVTKMFGLVRRDHDGVIELSRKK